jgi:hypothetical protein
LENHADAVGEALERAFWFRRNLAASRYLDFHSAAVGDDVIATSCHVPLKPRTKQPADERSYLDHREPA